MKRIALALLLTITGWGATATSLSDIAGQLDAKRKAGLGKPGTFSASESTAPIPPPMPLLIASEPDVLAPPTGVSASEALTGWWIYGPGGTRTYHYWQHAGHASASSRGHASSGHSSSGHASGRRR